MATVNHIVEKIKNLTKKVGAHVIAVDGFGGAGKSTIAQKIAAELAQSLVIPMDDFIVEERFYDDSWDEAFDRNAVKRKVISEGSHYDYVIVEGISSLYPQLKDLYDYKIWIDTPIDVAKSRGQKRDAGNKNEDKWDAWARNDLKYTKEHDPKELADTVLSNGDSFS